jgi:hypothetical protein
MSEKGKELLLELNYQIWNLGNEIRNTSKSIKEQAEKQRGRREFYHVLIKAKNELLKTNRRLEKCK